MEFCFNHRHGTEYPSMEVATTVKMLSGKTLCGEDLGRVSVVEMGNQSDAGSHRTLTALLFRSVGMNVAIKPFTRNYKMAEDEVQLNSGRFGYGSRHADASSPSALRVISWRCVRSLVG